MYIGWIRAAVVILLLTMSSNSFAYKRTLTTGSQGYPLFWKTGVIPYHVHTKSFEQLGIDKDQALNAIFNSFTTWQSPSCSCVKFQYMGDTGDSVLGYDQNNPEANKNIVIVRTQGWEHPSEAVAVTSNLFDLNSGRMVAFDIEINKQNFKFSTDGGRRGIDLQNAVTHEVGHVLGLDHADVKEATMYFSTPPGETKKRQLNQDDIDGICAIYALDTNGTCVGKGAPGTEIENPQGCACSSTGSGGIQSFFFPFLILFLFLRFFRTRLSTSLT